MFAQMVQCNLTSAGSAASVYKNLCKNEPISGYSFHKKIKFEIWAIYLAKSPKLRRATQSFEIAKTAILSPLRVYRPDMNPQNSSANPQKTVPAEYVPPMSLHRFCQITGLSKASAWRFEKRGWVRTHLIANRRCVLATDLS